MEDIKKPSGWSEPLPRVPYFYIIEYTPPPEAVDMDDIELTKTQKYSGVQYSKICNPANLLQPGPRGYRTSSVHVKKRMELFGLGCFKILEIVTEFGDLSAAEYEEAYQVEHKCNTSDEWLNRRNGNGKFVTTDISIANMKKSKNRYSEICPNCNEVITNKSAYSAAHGDKCKALPTHPAYAKYIARKELHDKYRGMHIDGQYICSCGFVHKTIKMFDIHYNQCIERVDSPNHCKREGDGRFTCPICGSRARDKTYNEKHGIYCEFGENKSAKNRQLRINQHNAYSYLLRAGGKFKCDCGYETSRLDRIKSHIADCVVYGDHPNHMKLNEHGKIQCPSCAASRTYDTNANRYMNHNHGVNCKGIQLRKWVICICGAKYNNTPAMDEHKQSCVCYPEHPNHKLPNDNGLYVCDRCGTECVDIKLYAKNHGINCKHHSIQDSAANAERKVLTELYDSLKHLENSDGVLQCGCGFILPESLKRFKIHVDQCVTTPTNTNHKLPNEHGYYECNRCGMWIMHMNVYRNKHGINCKTNVPYGYGVASIKKKLNIA